MDKFAQVTQYIDKVAQAVSAKFNVAASEVYKTLILQTRVDLLKDIFWIIFFVAAIITMIIIFKKMLKAYKNTDSELYGEDGIMWTTAVIMAIIGIIIIALIISCVLEIIQISVNPNYFIIKYYIMPLIK